jgi:serine/threonine-protein kinase
MVQSQAPGQPQRSSKAPIVIGMALTAALVGGGVYALTKQPAQSQGQAITTQVTAPSTTTAASATPTATSVEAIPAAALAPRRVKLVVVPSDVSVEVEGVATEASNGIVEITGAPGSVHRVRLSKGKSETITDVIITEAGPAPPKVELKATPKKAAAGATSKPGTGRPGIIDKFE